MTSFGPGSNPAYASAFGGRRLSGAAAGGRPSLSRQPFGPGSQAPQGDPLGGARRHRPGMAQPIQPQSQGTPYGQQRPWDPQQRYGYETREAWRAAGSPRGPAGFGRESAQQSAPVQIAPWEYQHGAPGRPGMAQPIRHAAPNSQPQSGQEQAFRPWRDGQGMSKGQIHQITHGRPFGVPSDTVEQDHQQYAPPVYAAAFTPGMAEPRPPQSTGTPYGMAATQVPGVTATPGWPNFEQEGPPFSSAMFDAFGNQTTPEQFYPQQQAMVSQIFDRLGQMDSGTYLGPGSPPPTWGRIPDFNYGDMWNQAGQMVQQGWQNPLHSSQGGFLSPAQANRRPHGMT